MDIYFEVGMWFAFNPDFLPTCYCQNVSQILTKIVDSPLFHGEALNFQSHIYVKLKFYDFFTAAVLLYVFCIHGAICLVLARPRYAEFWDTHTKLKKKSKGVEEMTSIL